ncbi:MAG: BamA/TamA family outer membrane protein [Rhodomicrobium sp.]|nr:BamA/TamA family outer membrane protein [Rhodomicrobium sp.]
MIAGADLEDVPATARFLAGGGGSVRGYAYRSVSPEIDGERPGGLSVADFSGELRIKVSETLGIVPFIDAAIVTNDSFFGGDSEIAAGAGLGFRYHTPIGPIRLDIATPLNRLDDEADIVFYVGLGQAF